MFENIAKELKDIERHVNEMAHLLIQAGFPIATQAYARAVSASLLTVGTGVAKAIEDTKRINEEHAKQIKLMEETSIRIKNEEAQAPEASPFVPTPDSAALEKKETEAILKLPVLTPVGQVFEKILTPKRRALG